MSEGEEVYCVCRTSDSSRFMICCDHCEEWYHGDCVNVNEKKAKYIKKYYCKQCRKLNPHLEIVYKSKHKEEKEKKHKHKDKDRERDRDREREKEERRKKEKRKEEKRRLEKEAERKKRKELEKLRQVDSPSPSALSRKTSIDSQNSPVNSPRPVKKKKVLREINYTSSDEDVDINVASGDDGKDDDEDEYVPSSKKRIYSSESEDNWEPAVAPSSAASKAKSSSSKSKGQAKGSKASKKTSAAHMASAETGTKRKRGRRPSASDSEIDEVAYWDPRTYLKGSRHCLGPKCIKEAREASKYCSDQCGIQLATSRIMQTLPDRVRQWNLAPSEAEKRNRQELEKIRGQQDDVKARLEQLNRDFRTLEELIAKGKSQTVEERDSDDEDDSSAIEMTVHCVTCGSDVQTRTAIRHMERCYNKMESQTSFASRFKTQIEDERMFCDYYNSKDGTYCKRLQVLCPDHNPDDKKVPRDDEVCGCPLQSEVFGESTEFCRSSKKACQAHYCWEKLRRAELDMERVKQWMKVDELLEQERQVKAAMSNRGGVLGLLLHSNQNHEAEAKWRMQQQQQQQHYPRPTGPPPVSSKHVGQNKIR